MTTEELQKILVALDACCETTNTLYRQIDGDIDTWNDNLIDCCSSLNDNLDLIIEIIENWGAEYSATYNGFLCQKQDNEVIDYEITFSDYLCEQELATTTTSTTEVATTTTTVDPDLIEWSISFEDYLCQIDLKSGTITTTEDETVIWEATYTDYECQKESDGGTTTTTTSDGSTTTTVSPDDVEFSSTYSEFLCAKTDDPLQTTTTSTETPIDEDDIDWTISFKNYLCEQELATTTTTTTASPGTTTTSTTEAITTTTTIDELECNQEVTGGQTFPSVYYFNVGPDTGQVTLTVDTVSAPDKFIVEFDEAEVINTGYVGDAGYQTALYAALASEGASAESIASTDATGTFTFNKGTASEIVTVKVYAPLEETDWSFTLSCVEAVSTTTTSGEIYSATYNDFECQEEDNGVTTTTTEAVTTTTTEAVTTTTTIPVYEVTCGAEEHTGGKAYPELYIVIGMGTGTGYVTLDYDTVGIPDKFIVEFDGVEVINTGYRGDVNLQAELNAALASYGDSAETIQGGDTGSVMFYKGTTTQLAIVKVYAPMEETEWSFTLTCPDDTITTTTTEAGATTTTTEVGTTTTTPVGPTTTTTTNAPPVSTDNSVSNDRSTSCAQSLELTPADFTFTDADGDDLDYVRINSYTLAGTGTLEYNGTAVADGLILKAYGGATGSFLYDLIYTPDASDETAYDDTIDFEVRTKNNTTYG